MPATLPETFGRYRIVRKLGQGGMGAVYLAEDTLMRRRVALKVPDFDGKEGQAVLERFHREARVAAEIRHQGVCPVHDVGVIGGVHFLTMAYIEGTTLHEALRGGDPWPASRAVELVAQIAEALHALHQKGIIHRDLKPGNVMIQPDGTPVLLDFGLARSLTDASQQLTAEGAAVGTPAYMAPEQISGKPEALGPHTDVYALGTILFRLLTGRMPFPRATSAELYGLLLHAERPRPSSVTAVGAGLDQLCLDMLARDPAQRPRTMPRLLARLRECDDNPEPTTQAHSPSAAAPAPDRRIDALSTADQPAPAAPVVLPRRNAWKRALMAGGCVVAVGVLATVIWLLRGVANPTTADTSPPPAVPEPTITNCIGMKFKLIPVGTFVMGSPAEEAEREKNEGQHEVEITKPFYMGVYEVTQEEYEAVMKTNPSYHRKGGKYEASVKGLADTKRLPVENVSWEDATEFCAALNKLAQEQGDKGLYRLPTEAEWEYCCRGGSPVYQVFHYGDQLSSREANFHGHAPYGGAEQGVARQRTVAVDDPDFKPNGFGLYHMHGNVSEWCADWYGDAPSGKVTDPRGPETGFYRVIRGGYWGTGAGSCRTAIRGACKQDLRYDGLGFRLARDATGGGQ